MTDTEKQDETMNCGLGVAEREILHSKLMALPDTPPPRAVWQRIEEQARAEGLFTSSRPIQRLRWISGAAIAATVAMIALNMPLTGTPVIDEQTQFSDVPSDVEASGPRNLNALKVQSQILEQNLRLLPDDPSVMKVSTATTIRELEDRIAAIDYRLNDRAVNLDSTQEEVFWRERVRLMNLLVQLRSARAQRTSF